MPPNALVATNRRILTSGLVSKQDRRYDGPTRCFRKCNYPIIETEIGMSRLTGTRELVALSGVEHGFDLASTNDIFTWTLTFLDAEVRGNPATQKQLSTMASVAGGGGDSVVIFYNGPP
jgi:hypothetical protein